MKLAFALILMLAFLGCFLPAIEAGKKTSSATISAGKTGDAAARQAAKEARQQRKITGVDKGK
uniref:Putative salivary basic peptide 4.2K-1 n=1 Tax=Aedes aegypti TaxID=7159 RepID=Q1HRT3_AEDAE|nr:putative salivary basic peptide 4.2K-1 [Aedes aegypti]